MGIIFLHSTKTCFLSFPTKAALQGPWPELHYMKLWKKNTISVKHKQSWKRAESLPHCCNKRLLLMFHLLQPWETNKTPVAVQNGPASLAFLSQPTNQSAKASMVQVWWQRSGRRLCRGMAHGAHCHSVASDRQHHLSFLSQRKYCPWEQRAPSNSAGESHMNQMRWTFSMFQLISI